MRRIAFAYAPDGHALLLLLPLLSCRRLVGHQTDLADSGSSPHLAHRFLLFRPALCQQDGVLSFTAS